MHPYRTATLVNKVLVSNSILKITFLSDVHFNFEPGQFASVCVGPSTKRLYSFSSPPDQAKDQGYEFCIKLVEGGVGSEFFSRLQLGETFQFQAPYGVFDFKSGRNRPVVFIGTGSGIAPLRSIALSKKFHADEIPFAMALFGFRHADEVPYAGEFEAMDIATRYAISTQGHRVTDLLRRFKTDFPWTECDYYICGNPQMIAEARRILASHFVPAEAVFYEAFESPSVVQLRPRLTVLKGRGDRAA